MAGRLRAEWRFFWALTAVNLSSAMEYRASFISQIVGMFINNGIYFVFWLVFIDQFGAVRGYGVDDIFLLYAIVTFGFGLGTMVAGNTGPNLAYLIAQGRLDYYLVLPRNLLLHVVFSRMSVPSIGDLTFGLVAYLFTGMFHPLDVLLFLLTSVLAGLIFVGFGIAAGSLAFFMGNAQYVSQQMSMGMVTFALYPNGLFSGAARLLLFTLLPAAFVGAVPVTIMQTRSGWLLLGLLGAVLVVWGVATAVFYAGLRRYESGSALNVNV
ncbi:MAG: ABC-2 family transporter protein [Anaerolineales bacterium]|nr:ABC-2 family transporter protein [Anaerolineales bacterium]